MQKYLVGGTVRDKLLGIDTEDRDWLVVGSDVNEMLQLGFKPVGKDFPVFIEPHSHEEYALARTEKKVAQGYHGFTFYADKSVTLEQDLSRRDLTINAMAEDQDGNLIDPFNGQQDLKEGILRHVSQAFAEDPVRILRVARFIAKFNFTVYPGTLDLIHQMIHSGEVDGLVMERVWQEFSKGLTEKYPHKMLQFLAEIGFFASVLPELDIIFNASEQNKPNFAFVAMWPSKNLIFEQRYALLNSLFANQELYQQFNKHFIVPRQCAKYAQAFYRLDKELSQFKIWTAEFILFIIEIADGFRQQQRFRSLIQLLAIKFDYYFPVQHLDFNLLLILLNKLESIDMQRLLQGVKAENRAQVVRQNRLAIIQQYL